MVEKMPAEDEPEEDRGKTPQELAEDLKALNRTLDNRRESTAPPEKPKRSFFGKKGAGVLVGAAILSGMALETGGLDESSSVRAEHSYPVTIEAPVAQLSLEDIPILPIEQMGVVID